MNVENTQKKVFNKVRPDILIFLFIILATFFIYWQVRNFEFINLDDGLHLKNTQLLGGFSLENIKWAFRYDQKTYWHPVTWLSYILNIQLYGMKPGGHHMANVHIHLINVLLLFAVFNKATGAPWKSAFVALMFAIHPINVESVAWVSEHKNVLSTMFWMLTMLAYVYYTKRRCLYMYLLSLLFFMLGLMAKPMLVTLPFVLILFDYWPLGRFKFIIPDYNFNKKRFRIIISDFRKSSLFYLIIEKVPFFILSAISVFLSSLSLQNQGIDLSGGATPVKLRVANALVSYFSYIIKMVWPKDLAIFYPYPETVPAWKAYSAFLFLICITLCVMRTFKKMPYIGVGWLWYMGTLFPVIGLVQAGLWPAMADRWAYVPFIGLFVIVAWGGAEFAYKYGIKKKWLTAAATMLFIIFTAASWIQVGYWKNSKSLFKHALDVTDQNFVAYNHLGLALAENGDTHKAIRCLEKTLQIYPYYETAHLTLGYVYSKNNNFDKAIFHYSEALRLNPNLYQGYNNLGILFASLGHINKAIEYYHKAIRINPYSSDSYNNLGLVLLQRGKIDEAIIHFERALQIGLNDANIRTNLNRSLTIKQKIEDATKELKETLEFTLPVPDLNILIEELNMKKAKLDNVIERFQKSLSTQPGFSGIDIKWLPLVEETLKEYKTKISLMNKMKQFQPESAEAYYYIACIYAGQNKTEMSVVWLEKAIIKGFKNWDLIKTDENLINIRKSKHYKELIKIYS
jgi:protein O-mannosyl-transferase